MTSLLAPTRGTVKSPVPANWNVVGIIRLPLKWQTYCRKADRIQSEHPSARSFPGGTSTLFAVPRPA